MILHDRTGYDASRQNWLRCFTTELVTMLQERSSHNSSRQN